MCHFLTNILFQAISIYIRKKIQTQAIGWTYTSKGIPFVSQLRYPQVLSDTKLGHLRYILCGINSDLLQREKYCQKTKWYLMHMHISVNTILFSPFYTGVVSPTAICGVRLSLFFCCIICMKIYCKCQCNYISISKRLQYISLPQMYIRCLQYISVPQVQLAPNPLNTI